MRAPAAVALLALLTTGCTSNTPDGAAARTSPAVTAAPVTRSPVAASQIAASPIAASPLAAPSTVPARSPAQTGSEGGVVLGGEDLGVTRLGAAMDAAVAAVTAVLGDPDEDPAEAVRCIQSEREVRWEGLVLAASNGRLAGWSSQSTTIQTPSGVAKGTTIAQLQRVYGDGLRRTAANPDNPPGFSVQGVDVLGSLSSVGQDAVVTALFSSFCSGP